MKMFSYAYHIMETQHLLSVGCSIFKHFKTYKHTWVILCIRGIFISRPNPVSVYFNTLCIHVKTALPYLTLMT